MDGFDSGSSSREGDVSHSNSNSAHKFIGIIMAVIFVCVAFAIWVLFAKWPKRVLHRWRQRFRGRSSKGGIIGAVSDEEEKSRRQPLEEVKLAPLVIKVAKPEKVVIFENAAQKSWETEDTKLGKC